MAGPSFIRAGYVPLLDSAVLIVAAAKGFAEERGIILSLQRETSWATVRDRIGVGQFDCAHMLAPMPIAANLGLGPLPVPMLAPMVLALGGNGVTVSNAVAEAMDRLGPAGYDASPATAGAALAAVVRRRGEAGEAPLRLAVVHPHSSHNYDLRYWLAACGIAPEKDVEITVVPPPLMPDALAGGGIDGFCAGEPWGTIAVQRGAGRIVTSRAEIWRRGPEKVLGVRKAFAEENPETLANLVLALGDAAAWCADPDSFPELARLLAGPERLDVAEAALLPGLAGRLETAPGRNRAIADFMVFAGSGANRPDPGHGRWLYRQMARWGDAPFSDDGLKIAGETFSPQHFEAAIGTVGDPAAAAAAVTGDAGDRPAGLFDAEG
ncbi:CmpA/NrtA family ABC transporter substrate-binding protein [Jiella pelagia]|uniref:CmpA/NrtA family ABC transporter substrate-binding protein n=1 Tax=Jiella pelagia TaxID=2986949 RepID=A0ABY7C408_9HYPH|nr:CmpA/NrtA family ABC transporter substrate-binding protein [Jiella pelagia]WAP70557.1 CmpA/NrtA family ABC transporter substrate-binding protein [Jiella pelagia]